mgnify:CR=1 FL=1
MERGGTVGASTGVLGGPRAVQRALSPPERASCWWLVRERKRKANRGPQAGARAWTSLDVPATETLVPPNPCPVKI